MRNNKGNLSLYFILVVALGIFAVSSSFLWYSNKNKAKLSKVENPQPYVEPAVPKKLTPEDVRATKDLILA